MLSISPAARNDRLTDACSGAQQKAIVRWNDEPVEHEFIFEPKGDQVEFRVFLINETVAGKRPGQVFIFTDSIYGVVWPSWKALRDMESRQSREEYEKQWREPFPEREMIELTNRVKELRSNSGGNKAHAYEPATEARMSRRYHARAG